MIDRPSLGADGLDALWDRVRRRLEVHGEGNRGRLQVPDLSPRARLTLRALLDRPPGKTVDLAALEASLVRLQVGHDLAAALASLGHPVSTEPARRRAALAAARRARVAARDEAATWPEPWASEWVDEVVRAGALRGYDDTAARGFVQAVRRVLDHLDADRPAPTSRVDLAAEVLGSSHALDTGTRLEAATTRALVHRLGPAASRDLWERAGAHLDLTSGPALVWGLPLLSSSGLAPLVDQATELGVPVHLTQLALRRHPTAVRSRLVVLVVENPRIVEAAAQAAVTVPVIATNGNPSGAVRLLLAQLLESGAELRYHGDFDAAGLALCARMAQMGLTPWRMTTDDYQGAVAAAGAAGIELPVDAGRCGATPWEPRLQGAFNRLKQVVHEERLAAELLRTIQ